VAGDDRAEPRSDGGEPPLEGVPGGRRQNTALEKHEAAAARFDHAEPEAPRARIDAEDPDRGGVVHFCDDCDPPVFCVFSAFAKAGSSFWSTNFRSASSKNAGSSMNGRREDFLSRAVKLFT